MDVRPYDADRDRGGLWRLKRAFELELSSGTDEAKRTAYEAKLTDDYRERYLDWVDRCVGESAECVTVAVADSDRSPASSTEPDGGLVGYGFLLPESLAHVWDAAVLNEIFVAPDWRGSGVADRLLAAALRVARSQSLPMDRVVLDVAPSNDRARAFYARHGFEPWGQLVAREL